MKYAISKIIICLSLFVTISSHAESTLGENFEVFTTDGQRVHYNAETQTLSIFDVNGQLQASGETTPVTSVAGNETISSITRSYSINTSKENFTVTISTVGTFNGSELTDTGVISKAELIQKSIRTRFLPHEFKSLILVDEFSRSATPEKNFSITTASGTHAVYDFENNTMTISDLEKGRLWTNLPVHYVRTYKSNMVLHLFSVSKGNQTYTVEFVAEITDRKLHQEDLLRVNLVSERPGLIFSERFTDRVETNRVNFNPLIIRPLKCNSLL